MHTGENTHNPHVKVIKNTTYFIKGPGQNTTYEHWQQRQQRVEINPYTPKQGNFSQNYQTNYNDYQNNNYQNNDYQNNQSYSPTKHDYYQQEGYQTNINTNHSNQFEQRQPNQMQPQSNNMYTDQPYSSTSEYPPNNQISYNYKTSKSNQYAYL